jgi:PAS domain S-box-containing protein
MTIAPILIVEDNTATRKMLRLVLQAEGHSVVEAENGETALRLAAECTPSIVLLDCGLPDMDGFEVARRLHIMAPSLGVVAVTGWVAADDERVLSAGAGFLDVLVKPVEASLLLRVVEQHLGPARPRVGNAGKSVLLVDDDPTQRKLGHLALAAAGFHVTVAEDGEVALKLALEQRPDVILTDVLMPGLDGFGLCKAIRGEATLQTVPVVLMSAHYVEDDDRRLGTRFGATRYVSRTGGFEAVVRSVLDAMVAPPAPPVAPPPDDVQSAYLRRIVRQLERQASISTSLARQVSLQATALSLLDGLGVSLSRQRDPESVLGDTLAECLHASGLSVGTILLLQADGHLAVRAHLGPLSTPDWRAHSEVLLRTSSGGGQSIPSAQAGPQGDALLADLGVDTALVVPIIARDELLGVLLLASAHADLASAEGESFVRAARSVSVQLGQVLALGRMFSQLASAEERYRVLLENATDSIGVLTTAGVILEANKSWQKLMGMPREDLVDHNVAEFIAPEPGGVQKSASDAFDSQEEGTLRPMSFQRPDGTLVHVELSQTVVNVGGEPYIFAVGRDLTARIRLEERLRQAQKMEAIGTLAGGVAHDFNNMLSVILGYSSLLLDEMKPNDPVRDELEEIKRAGERAQGLTHQLLAFSRQQVLEPKVLDLNPILGGMKQMIRRLLGESVELSMPTSTQLGRVYADPGQVEQVVMNLAVNARDAMPNGGKFSLETSNVELSHAYASEHEGVAPGPYVVLAATDTGCGMDVATRARIFEPFFTTKEVGRGTGLGLATVFGIVKQSAGHVAVDSQPGRGAAFRIYFPQTDHATDVTTSVASMAPSLRGSETVLLIEDEDAVRAVIRRILARNGYQVLDAQNGGEALLICEQHAAEIHLILTDVVMPRMSGKQLVDRLLPLRPQMKVLFVSGYTDDLIVRHGVRDAGMAFLQKPITPKSLLGKVREVLDSRSVRTTERPGGVTHA